MSGRAWSEDLQCEFESWQVDEPRELLLRLPVDCYCDMTGAIKVAKFLMPDVNKVVILSGGKLSMLYVLLGEKWHSVDLSICPDAARH